MRVVGSPSSRGVASFILSTGLALGACSPSVGNLLDAAPALPDVPTADVPLVDVQAPTDVPVLVDVPAPIDVSAPIDVPIPIDVPAPLDVPAPIDVPPDTGAPVDVGVDVPAPLDVRPDVPCASGETRCGAACVSTATDLAHCGACDRACGPANAVGVCTAGACRVMRCNTGAVDCDGEPANGCEATTATDARNCGGCGIACGGAATCVAGACTCAGVTCAGRCVDTSTDSSHCGACGFACPSGVTCASARCGTMGCATGLTDCGSRCVDASTDGTNCGACGRVCGTGSSCIRGACATTPWLQLFGGAGSGDVVNAVTRDAAGNVYVAGAFSGTVTLGTTTYTGGARGWIARLSPTGSVLWSATAGLAVRSLATDAAGNLYAVGHFSGTTTVGPRMLGSAGSVDWFAASFAPDGTVRWAVRQGGAGEDYARRVAVDAAGRVWVGGFFSGTTVFDGRSATSVGNIDLLVAQLDASDGSARNFVTFGSSAQDFIGGLTAEPSDGAAVLLHFSTRLTVGATTIDAGSNDGAILRFGPDLSLRWSTLLDGGSGLDVSDLVRDAAGNLYAAGDIGSAPIRVGGTPFGSGPSYFNGYVLSVNPAGTFRWGVYVVGDGGTSNREGVDALSLAPDGTLYALGYVESPALTVGSLSVPRSAGRASWLAAINASGTATSGRIAATGVTVSDQVISVGADDVLLGGRMYGVGNVDGNAVTRTSDYDGFLSRSPR